MPNAKILIWDLETTDLKSDWGTLLCVGYKWLGQRYGTVLSITDYDGWQNDMTNDKELVTDFHKILAEADMLVTYYGKMFDLPWLQGKFLEYDLPALPAIPHVDLYFVGRSNLRLTRRSLDNLAKYLRIGAKKYYVTGDLWKKARVGDPVALDKVRKHCYADIQLTEKLYYKLRPYVRQHPRINGYFKCRYCGSDKVQRRGYQISNYKGRQQRVQCQECLGWSSYPERDLEDADTD